MVQMLLHHSMASSLSLCLLRRCRWRRWVSRGRGRAHPGAPAPSRGPHGRQPAAERKKNLVKAYLQMVHLACLPNSALPDSSKVCSMTHCSVSASWKSRGCMGLVLMSMLLHYCQVLHLGLNARHLRNEAVILRLDASHLLRHAPPLILQQMSDTRM